MLAATLGRHCSRASARALRTATAVPFYERITHAQEKDIRVTGIPGGGLASRRAVFSSVAATQAAAPVQQKQEQQQKQQQQRPEATSEQWPIHVDHDVHVLSLTSGSRFDAMKFLTGVFRSVAEHELEADLVATSGNCVTLAFTGAPDSAALERLTEQLAGCGVQCEHAEGHALLRCATRGTGPCEFQMELQRVFAAHHISSRLFVSNGAPRADDTETGLVSIVVHQNDLDMAVEKISEVERFIPTARILRDSD